ncbi:putative Transglycosylase [Pseudomonas syringae pv. maculicola]|nr:putative Transglycosylase [Pseudomonas syringae pv. maculicola]
MKQKGNIWLLWPKGMALPQTVDAEPAPASH